jgi:hypothetical protein
LLFHCFENASFVLILHGVELVDATDAFVGENESARFECPTWSILDRTGVVSWPPFDSHALTRTAVAVKPALVEPTPVVSTALGIIFATYFRKNDLPVPGSPTISKWD